MSKILVSYAYFRGYDLHKLAAAAGPDMMMFGDSGAYSARTLGIRLAVPHLAAWIRQWNHLFTVYANLDVIGAPDATWRNQLALEAEGLYPLPVFHTGEPLSILDRYLEAGHRYIALGGLVGRPRANVLAWLARIFNHADSQAVFHGFGLTVWEALRDFPFYSVDSSSWGGAFRYATVKLFNSGTWTTVKLRDQAAIRKHWQLIERHGGHPSQLTAARYDCHEVARISANAVRLSEAWLRRRHHVPLPDAARCPIRRGHGLKQQPSAPPGPHVYLAGANAKYFTQGALAPPRGPHVYIVDGKQSTLLVGASVQEVTTP